MYIQYRRIFPFPSISNSEHRLSSVGVPNTVPVIVQSKAPKSRLNHVPGNRVRLRLCAATASHDGADYKCYYKKISFSSSPFNIKGTLSVSSLSIGSVPPTLAFCCQLFPEAQHPRVTPRDAIFVVGVNEVNGAMEIGKFPGTACNGIGDLDNSVGRGGHLAGIGPLDGEGPLFPLHCSGERRGAFPFHFPGYLADGHVACIHQSPFKVSVELKSSGEVRFPYAVFRYRRGIVDLFGLLGGAAGIGIGGRRRRGCG